MVPVGCLDRCYKIGNAWTVLSNRHAHLTGCAGVSIRAHACVTLVGAIPKLDTCGRKEIRNWHHGRTNNAKGVINSVHLKHFYKGLFGRHFHGTSPPHHVTGTAVICTF
ncbi:hypothetical protein PsW74_01868 [Pseudovibrio sp. W74]|nr:hypothetical protein PsW74_01868 [Pseudovibrio sp. W74]